WFRAAFVAAILLLLAGMYRLRMMYLARWFNLRMEERVNERTRIARELHDTMLQSFQGVLLKFHAATSQITDQPELKRSLQQTVEQAAQAINEGREAVQALRSSTVETNNLAQAITALADELAHTQRDRSETAAPEFALHVE